MLVAQTMIATAIMPAMSAYSMTVTPASSSRKRLTRFMGASRLRHTASACRGRGLPESTAAWPKPRGSMRTRELASDRAGDTRESRVQLAAEGAGADDNGNADQRRDQAILDGGHARLILGEKRKELLHRFNSYRCLLRWLGYAQHFVAVRNRARK